MAHVTLRNVKFVGHSLALLRGPRHVDDFAITSLALILLSLSLIITQNSSLHRPIGRVCCKQVCDSCAKGNQMGNGTDGWSTNRCGFTMDLMKQT